MPCKNRKIWSGNGKGSRKKGAVCFIGLSLGSMMMGTGHAKDVIGYSYTVKKGADVGRGG